MLTSKNAHAGAWNRALTTLNGEVNGTHDIYAMPLTRADEASESRKRKAQKLFRNAYEDSMNIRSNDSFLQPRNLSAREGMPAIVNICPELGLCNGARGQVVAVAFENQFAKPQPREALESLANAGRTKEPRNRPNIACPNE